MANQELIAQVGLDQSGRIYVRPQTETFEYIYRAAMGVRWDEKLGRLFPYEVGDWLPKQWFSRIVDAVRSEYGVELKTGPATAWSIPADLRSEIEGSLI
jgi:hypothetical protein